MGFHRFEFWNVFAPLILQFMLIESWYNRKMNEDPLFSRPGSANGFSIWFWAILDDNDSQHTRINIFNYWKWLLFAIDNGQ